MNFVYNTPILNKINIPNLQFRSAAVNYAEPAGIRQDSFASNPLYAKFVEKGQIDNKLCKKDDFNFFTKKT